MEIIIDLVDIIAKEKERLEKIHGVQFNVFHAYKIDPTDLAQQKELQVPELYDQIFIRFK